MDTISRFLQACVTELKRQGLSVSDLDKETPPDFWDGVFELLKDEWASAIDLEMYWELHKTDLAPLLERRLTGDAAHVEIEERPAGSKPAWLLAPKKSYPVEPSTPEDAGTNPADSDSSDADTVEIDDSVIFEKGTDIFDPAMLGSSRRSGDPTGEEPTGPIGPEMISIMMQELERRLTKTLEDRMECAVETRVAEFLKSKYGALGAADRDEPPLPPKKGKKFLGEKRDIRGRIDANLWELFQKECTEHNGNVSKTLDTILWRYFGKPRLSFEDD